MNSVWLIKAGRASDDQAKYKSLTGTWPYLEEYPIFLRPPDDTPINFIDMEQWDWFKMPFRYSVGRVSNRIEVQSDGRWEDPPPPYEP